MRSSALVVSLCAVWLIAWPGAAWAAEWSAPVAGATLLVGFGAEYSGCVHRGVDLAGTAGEAVTAPTAGAVVFAGSVPADGGGSCYAVTIELADGRRLSLLPLARVDMRAGDTVGRGDALGSLAACGDDSSDVTHVHIGLRAGERYVDPTPMLALGPIPEPSPSGGEGACLASLAEAASDRDPGSLAGPGLCDPTAAGSVSPSASPVTSMPTVSAAASAPLSTALAPPSSASRPGLAAPSCPPGVASPSLAGVCASSGTARASVSPVSVAMPASASPVSVAMPAVATTVSGSGAPMAEMSGTIDGSPDAVAAESAASSVRRRHRMNLACLRAVPSPLALCVAVLSAAAVAITARTRVFAGAR